MPIFNVEDRSVLNKNAGFHDERGNLLNWENIYSYLWLSNIHMSRRNGSLTKQNAPRLGCFRVPRTTNVFNLALIERPLDESVRNFNIDCGQT